MSLLSDTMQECVMLDKKTVSDGEGGFVVDYTDGAQFTASVTTDQQGVAKIAQALTETVEYRVITRKKTILNAGDVFKTLKDGRIYRVKSSNLQATPDSAELNMRLAFAEEWSI